MRILHDALAKHISLKNIDGIIHTIEQLIQKTQYDPSRPRDAHSGEFLKIISAESAKISVFDYENYTIMSLLLSAIGGETAFKNKVVYLRIDIDNHRYRKVAF